MAPRLVPPIKDRLLGSLLGLAVGDAIGARLEGAVPDALASRFPTPRALLEEMTRAGLYYTDDTHMAMGVAEALVASGTIVEDRLARVFADNYAAEPFRGYGRGARAVLEAIGSGEDHREAASSYFQGGSFGNGGAMRVAPLGVFFHRDLNRVEQEAARSARPTHTHPLGVEGTVLQALAAALAVRAVELSRDELFDELARRARTADFRHALGKARVARDERDLRALGTDITALGSVPTAIACFALHPDDYEEAVARAVLLGGDTDTIAAMAGALSGAYLGATAIPRALLDALEDRPGSKGRSYITRLGRDLCARHRADLSQGGNS